ncbi:hypothetical protein V1478_005518 [Vespula squamosa]|uniref:Uncharacterized protein n=1 Tax=Vespula squamosa TaxID=30214 RepID=A0ABD2BEF9_VESSQ
MRTSVELRLDTLGITRNTLGIMQKRCRLSIFVNTYAVKQGGMRKLWGICHARILVNSLEIMQKRKR